MVQFSNMKKNIIVVILALAVGVVGFFLWKNSVRHIENAPQVVLSPQLEVDAASPSGSVVEVGNKLYGLTSGGGKGDGVLYAYDLSTHLFSKKYDFGGEAGERPVGSLLAASNGKLYGVTYAGGSKGNGTIFEYDPVTSVLSKKSDFTGANGGHPDEGHLVEFNNKIYGVAYPADTCTGGFFSLFEFNNQTNSLISKACYVAEWGHIFLRPIMVASDGKFYGFAERGTTDSNGILYRYDPSTNNFENLKSISDKDGIGYPNGLVQTSNDRFYGITYAAFGPSTGSIFEYGSKTGTFVVKQKFGEKDLNGSEPESIINGLNGTLYGTTKAGGVNGKGTIFEFDTAKDLFVKKYDFDGVNGSTPIDSLLLAADGNLYGVTSQGGTFDQGVLFQYNVDKNTFTKLYDFQTKIDYCDVHQCGMD